MPNATALVKSLSYQRVIPNPQGGNKYVRNKYADWL